MSAFLSYPGGKSRIGGTIASHLAPHDIYVEPFSGTCAVLFAKPRADFEIVNDINGNLVTLLRVVRDRPDDLWQALALTPYSRAEYKAADPDEPGLGDVERARRTCVRIGQSFAKVGLADWTKGWRISVRCGRSCAETWADTADRVLAGAERLRGVHIEQLPAVDLIARYGNEPGAAVYVDPPYLGTTRAKAIYAHEMPDEEDHRALAAALADCRAHVLLSGYHSPLYDELYAGWDVLEIAAVANHNGNTGTDVRRTEVLWSNRPLGLQGSIFDPAEAAA